MTTNSEDQWTRPNPSLKDLEVLLGEWDTVGTHPALPGTLHGRASFQWHEDGAFIIMHTSVEEPGVPSSVAIFGRDDSGEGYSMLYYDERGVARIYAVSLTDNVWKMW